MNRTFSSNARYVRRVVDDQLDELMTGLSAISLDGPKGVGKTSTASQRGAKLFALDHPPTLEVVRANPDRLIIGPEPIVIDEWQLFPAAWDLVRRAVDTEPRAGRFILTGSTSPKSPQTHSGAGRIVPVRMRPLTLGERGVGTPTVSLGGLLRGGREDLGGSTDATLETYVHEILASGLPGVRQASDRARRELLRGYVELIVDRDFPESGQQVRNPAALRRWLAAYAAATSTTAAYDKIRDASTSGQGDKPAKTTTMPYRDTLERLWLLDPVPAWVPTNNHLRRLTESPKHHLADPALAAILIGATAASLLDGRAAGPSITRDGTLLGALFESLIALSLRVFAQACEARVFHLRTAAGEHEIDFIVETPDSKVIAIEVKLAQTIGDADVKHLRWLARELGPDLIDAVVITTGPEAYRRKDGIAVVPAALLGA